MRNIFCMAVFLFCLQGIKAQTDSLIDPAAESAAEPVADAAANSVADAAAVLFNGFVWEFSPDKTAVYITGYTGADTALRIPAYIEKLPVTAVSGFAGNDKIVSVEIPETVIELKTEKGSLYRGAFADCTALQSVALPESLQKIGSHAFAGCSALETIVLSDNIVDIGPQAFSDCAALTKINVPKNLKKLNWAVFCRCVSLAEIEIPEGLVEIAYLSFSDCIQLQKIVLPQSLRHIGPQAFDNCASLAEIIVQGEDINFHDYGNGIFAGCVRLADKHKKALSEIGYTGSFD